MATNPKLPDFPNIPPRKPQNPHGKVQLIRQNKFPWPILIVITSALLLIGIFAVLPKTPPETAPSTSAQVPQQPTADQVQLTNLKLMPAPAGGAVYLTGILRNVGDTAITGVQVQAQFLGRNGPVLQSVTVSVQGLVGGTNTQAQDLTQAPIKPHDSRPVRIYFEHTPPGWNRRLPELTVTNVTGTTP
jgi:hypothetical protein